MLQCATTQETVNTAMTGEDWRDRAGLLTAIDYPMAALDEACEFWKSAINFKWWAKTAFELDIPNAVVELVDMMHFGLSQDLIKSNPGQVASRMAEAYMASDDIDPASPFDPQGAKVSMKAFIHGVTAPSPTVNWLAFWNMASSIGVDPKVLVTKYRAKAILNQFRTRKGAKEGTYVKKWLSGKEDNFYLMQWVDVQIGKGVHPTDQEISSWLDEAYTSMATQSTF